MVKNCAGQRLIVYAFDTTTNAPHTGLSDITAYVSKDDGNVTVLADTTATQINATNAKGYYRFDLTQGETNAEKLMFTAKSATSGVVCICRPDVVWTERELFQDTINDTVRGFGLTLKLVRKINTINSGLAFQPGTQNSIAKRGNNYVIASYASGDIAEIDPFGEMVSQTTGATFGISSVTSVEVDESVTPNKLILGFEDGSFNRYVWGTWTIADSSKWNGQIDLYGIRLVGTTLYALAAATNIIGLFNYSTMWTTGSGHVSATPTSTHAIDVIDSDDAGQTVTDNYANFAQFGNGWIFGNNATQGSIVYFDSSFANPAKVSVGHGYQSGIVVRNGNIITMSQVGTIYEWRPVEAIDAALITKLLASAKGDVTPVDNNDGTFSLTFKAEDGTTAFSKTYNPTTGERS